jgi:signal transduction histidine kinase/CheY-like chemotaxis protein
MFQPFRPSIRRKVVLMQMVTASTALLLAAVAFLVLEAATFNRTESRELLTLGQLIASNAAPMVAFEDPEAASRILDGLAVRPSIIQARIYRASGDLMAGYPATAPQGAPMRAGSVQEGITSAQNRLRLTQVIRDREGAAIGVLFLEEDLRELQQRILTSALVLGGVLVLLGLASLIVSFWVQGLLTRPILDLSAVAAAVSRTQDYRLRARPWAEDELGHLVEAFNTMLDKIQTQDEQLAEHREHLEQQVDHRTLQLTRANEELRVAKARAEAFSRAKSAFLSNMSHELRTPLNSILGYTQLMAFDADRDPQDRRQLDMILRAGEHLLGLINDVLSVSRIEAQQQVLTPAPFDLRAFLLGLEEMIRVRAKAKGIALDVELDPALRPVLVGDEGKLRQVLVNLLGNAVKFTHEGGVRLTIRARGQNRVFFEVQDTGAGISAEEAAGLFTAFFQTGAGRRAQEGTGLGLYLSQSLVRLMGGEVQVESQIDQGTRFFFEVPLPPGEDLPLEERALPGLPRIVKGQAAPRQLVVDDNEDNRSLMAALFARMNLPCKVAADGAEALACWRDWRPAVVWMDMRMPGMDGFEATRRIRAEEAGGARTAIVAVTASVFEDDRDRIHQCGCDDVLIKPYRVRDLMAMLGRHTGLRFQEGPAEAVSETSPERLQGSLREASPQWLAVFEAALNQGEIDRARDLLRDLPEALARGLTPYLDEFRLDDLERLLLKARETP